MGKISSFSLSITTQKQNAIFCVFYIFIPTPMREHLLFATTIIIISHCSPRLAQVPHIHVHPSNVQAVADPTPSTSRAIIPSLEKSSIPSSDYEPQIFLAAGS